LRAAVGCHLVVQYVAHVWALQHPGLKVADSSEAPRQLAARVGKRVCVAWVVASGIR
jgi:hypothetical protein